MVSRDDGTRSLTTLDELREAVNHCRRCPLWRPATQGVPGEGDQRGRIMLVGEQPGDAEDIQGHPFVGPAGALLDKAVTEAGFVRDDLWITNAVKHFKYEQRGKRRLHKKPSTGEITACRWWLTEELRLVEPQMVVALGASAARSLLGRPVTISSMRGQAHPLHDALLWVTIHPSYLLRIREDADRKAEYERFVKDLRDVYAAARRTPPRAQPPGRRTAVPSVRSGA
jgi:uracil-DNA glycosylase